MDGEEQLQRSDSDLATLLKGKAKAHFDPEGDGTGYVELRTGDSVRLVKPHVALDAFQQILCRES